jgi:hypothetical protein
MVLPEAATASKIQGKLIEVRFREGADLKKGEIAALLNGKDVNAAPPVNLLTRTG